MRGPQKFNIHKSFGGAGALPSAHTCFNTLDLPEYESERACLDKLRVALSEGNTGFAFG